MQLLGQDTRQKWQGQVGQECCIMLLFKQIFLSCKSALKKDIYYKRANPAAAGFQILCGLINDEDSQAKKQNAENEFGH